MLIDPNSPKPICTVIYHYHPADDTFTANAYEMGTGAEIAHLKTRKIRLLTEAIEKVCIAAVEFMSGTNEASDYVGLHRLNYLRKMEA
jgi:hypothetical protein